MSDSHDAGPPSSGIMVIRVWSEAGRPDAFRARLTVGIGDDDAQTTVFADGDEVLESVRTWLGSFAPPPTLPGPDASTEPGHADRSG